MAGLVAWKRPDRALQVATANVAQTLCADVFVSGLAPDRVFAKNIAPEKGMQMRLPHLRYVVDSARQKVIARWHGGFTSKATYSSGYGCALRTTAPDAATLKAAREVAPATAMPAEPIASNDPAIAGALAYAFAEPASGPRRHVHAIVVLHDGKIIAGMTTARG